MVAYVFTLPESPRYVHGVCGDLIPLYGSMSYEVNSWLLLKARSGDRAKYKKAFESLKTLRRTRLQAARDLFLINHLLNGEEKIKQQRHRFTELWLVPRNRRALIASLIVMFFQQFCGVNVLAYVSSFSLHELYWLLISRNMLTHPTVFLQCLRRRPIQ